MNYIINFPALAGIAATSFIIALSGALMPGPLLTVTISEAARRGTKAGPLLITGHAILELLLVIAITRGMGPYLKALPVIGTISLLGGVTLILMGVDMIRKSSTLSLRQNNNEIKRNNGHPIFLGFISSLANPYWIIWWVTIGLGYLAAASHFGFLGIAAFLGGHIAADYGWYIIIAFGIARSKTVFQDSIYHILIRFCGFFLIIFGSWFLTSAFHNFSGIIQA